MLKSLSTWRLLLAGVLALATVFSVTNSDHAFAATFAVGSTGDGTDVAPGNGLCETATTNECTLRAAIQEANAFAGTDTIAFNLLPSGPHTITPATSLPAITQPVIVDGTTQPGFAGSPIIELNGSVAGQAFGLNIGAGGSTVRALVINRWQTSIGVVLHTNGGNRLEGNYIGTDMTGTVALPNDVGVRIFSGAGNTIGGTSASARNVISGNGSGITGYGIFVGASGNLIQGNFIGTDATGSVDLGNSGSGVYILALDANNPAGNNTIGGTTVGARNVISGNGIRGVHIEGSGATGNLVQGNFIGTDASGTVALGNNDGVYINAANNTIGGTTVGARNVISGNNAYGVVIGGSGATGNLIRGNSIHDNDGQAIENINGGNTELAPPVVTAAGGGSASGTALAGCTVDVYSDDVDEGRVYHGAATVTGSTWSYSGGILRPYVTATCTNAGANTSEFSPPFIHDTDGDGFSDYVENMMGTDPFDDCGVDAWPADINNDGFSDTSDIVFLTGNFGAAVPPALARYDIAPDGFIDTRDIAQMTAVFGQGC